MPCICGAFLHVNFTAHSGGDWIVEALKLFEQSPVLRRMFYAVVVVGLLWGIAEVLPGVAQLIGGVNG